MLIYKGINMSAGTSDSRPKFIEFMGKIVQIEEINGKIVPKDGPKVEELYNELRANEILLDDSDAVAADNIFTAALEDSFTEIQEQYKAGIKKLALNLLGMEYSWNEWKVKEGPLNNYLASMISDVVKSDLKGEIEKIDKLELTLADKKALTKSLKLDVKRRYQYTYEAAFAKHFEKLILAQAENDAKAAFDDLLKSNTQDSKTLLADMLTNIKRINNRR